MFLSFFGSPNSVFLLRNIFNTWFHSFYMHKQLSRSMADFSSRDMCGSFKMATCTSGKGEVSVKQCRQMQLREPNVKISTLLSFLPSFFIMHDSETIRCMRISRSLVVGCDLINGDPQLSFLLSYA